MQPGDTFLYSHPKAKKHLLIIVCARVDDPVIGEIFHCVYLTTLYNTGNEDAVCLFQKGDHPFITHDSYVEYSQLLHIRAEFLQRELAIGFAVSKDPISAPQLLAIKTAAGNSDAIRPRDLSYFQ